MRFGYAALLPMLSAIAPMPAMAAPADAVSALLLKQTQEFSDASSHGDAAVMQRLLDDRVVFFNEGGDSTTKAEMVASAKGPTPGVDVRQKVIDWHCETFGDTAVGSFIDDQFATAAGVVTHAQYRSVETWRRSDDGQWRMIGSETIALQGDPVAVDLPAATLGEYVGTYVNSAGLRFTFALQGGHIAASLNDGPQTVQAGEVRDVLFTPGRARFRKVFQRDADGKVVSFAYRHEGHDMMFKRVS
ncbi:MAG: DUF4440 domain-containing protein [Pseudomonadota bacterium]|nr:DUF4440 domain-containing protein [Pseudomonadota bacterium]